MAAFGNDDDAADQTELLTPSSLIPIAGTANAYTLLVYGPTSVERRRIARGASLSIGRSAPATLIVPDKSLSRNHARIAFEGEELFVEDLGSRNGTMVNGRATQRAALLVGDRVMVGTSVVAIEAAELSDRGVGTGSYDQLLLALDRETARARTFQRTFALLAVRAPGRGDTHVSRWSARVLAKLAPADFVTTRGSASLLVLLPERTREEAVELARGLVRRESPELHCSVTSFPGDGTTTHELIERATSLLLEATANEPIAVSRTEASAARGAFIVDSPAMRALRRTIEQVARANVPVLVVGETGSGKELVAREIHAKSPRANAPFRAVNCAAISPTLMESTLFGHEKGAFTGAHQTTPGLFEQAAGGSLFLDELGELPPNCQAALLRVLETRCVMRVGGQREIPVDVRVIAATHRDLAAMAQAGTFRSDLMYRLNTVTLELPPLRDRREEIEPLAEHFLALAAQTHGLPSKRLTSGVIGALTAYHWPGNVRELRNVIDRAMVVGIGATVEISDLPATIRDVARDHDESASVRRSDLELRGKLKNLEATSIAQAMDSAGGNKTKAAKLLGIPLRTFMRKVQAYGLERRDKKE